MYRLGYKILFQFIAVFCALSFVPFLYFHTQFSMVEAQTQQHVEQLNRNKLEYSKVELQTTVLKVTASLRYLSNNRMLNQAILDPTQKNFTLLEEFWLLIARTQGYYSQLRYLNADGLEIVRINSSEGSLEIVDKDQLQDKSNRDYFLYAKTLGDHDTGSYGIDLEVENGQVVVPYTPAYRALFPVSLNGDRQGYFVANLDLMRIYRSLAYKREKANLPNVVTKDGFYLVATDDNQIMGNILKQHADSNIATQHPQLWRALQLHNHGTVKERDHWISYTTIGGNTVESFDELILFIKTPLAEAQAFTDTARQDLYIQASFILIILCLLTFTFITWNRNHEKNSMDSKIARAAMNGMSAVVITDRHNRIIQVNSEFTRISGFTLDDVKGKSPSLFASGKHKQEFYMEMWAILEKKGLWEGEVVNKRRDGSLITEILRIQTIKDRSGVIQYYVASFVDISHLKQLENQLRELSEKDPLTSLWNRRKFDKEMQNQSSRIKRYSATEVATLALIDIDHFKRINDKYGHDQGDEVIKQVAHSLGSHLRETDVLARIGGEEFAIIMPHTVLKEAEIVVNRLRIAVNIETELNVTVSGGLTEISAQPKETYKRADIALYESKSLGRNRVSVLSESESDSFV